MFEQTYVSFSSSGVWGFLFPGIVNALEDEHGDWTESLRGVAGTSGGAVMALVVALRIPRVKRNRLLRYFSSPWDVYRAPDIALMVKRYGLEDGSGLRNVIESILEQGGLSPHTTMDDLKRLLRMDVVFVAHNISTGKVVHMSAEETPCMRVVDAVFASCAIPFIFTPFESEPGVYLCDGGLTEHVPDVFPEAETLHVVCPITRSIQIDSWYDYMRALFFTTVHQQESRIARVCSLPNAIVAFHPIISGMDPLCTDLDTQRLETMTHYGYVVAVWKFHKEEMVRVFRLLLSVFLSTVTATDSKEAPECEYASEDDQGN